jgi:plastocyanin
MHLKRSSSTILSSKPGRALLSGVLLLLAAASAQAANETITWGFSPTPTSVSILVGETVTWDGNLSFHPVQITNSAFTLAAAATHGRLRHPALITSAAPHTARRCRPQ